VSKIRERSTPTFIVDQMLGELSRWLRILGYDAEYSKDLTDQQLIQRSRIEKRILLTSDQELYRRALKENVECLLLRPESLVRKLSTLARIFKLDLSINPAESRCPICNGQVRETSDLAELQDRVPSGIRESNKKFWICTKCSKVYWMGGHWKGISRIIEEVNELLRSGGE
jgi:uncharacterized protein with PIN domain